MSNGPTVEVFFEITHGPRRGSYSARVKLARPIHHELDLDDIAKYIADRMCRPDTDRRNPYYLDMHHIDIMSWKYI